jgi:hypothetical protein
VGFGSIQSKHLNWPLHVPLFINSDQTPTQLGFKGTWAKIAAGRMIIGVDTNDSVINAAGKTGGSTDPLTSHRHQLTSLSTGYLSSNVNNNGKLGAGAPDGAWATNVPAINTLYTGDSANHANWPPFYALNIWERTA